MRRVFCLLTGLFLITQAQAQDAPPSAQDIRMAIAGQIASFKISPQPVSKIINKKIYTGVDSVSLRFYYGSNAGNLPVIYQVHGGALVAGDLDTHDNICRVLAKQTGSLVVAIDYHKPPEYPYPIGFNECYFALGWIYKHIAGLGGNPNVITVLGDSGGGLFVAGLPVKMNQEKQIIPLKGIVLINPAVDLRKPGDGMYGLVTNWYLHGKNANDPVISPLTAPNVKGFPPTLVVICQNDELKQQGEDWVAKLKAGKIETTVLTIPNEGHLGGYWAAAHPRAQAAIDAVVYFFKHYN